MKKTFVGVVVGRHIPKLNLHKKFGLDHQYQI